MKKIIIDDSSANQRFDRFLRKYFKATPEIKLGDIFSWIRKGSIKVNNKKSKQDYRLSPGDIITRDDNILTDKKASNIKQPKQKKIASRTLENIAPFIIHEDTHRIVRNKPADIIMHPGDKHITDITLHDLMVSYLQKTDQRNASATYSPSFCYRLDKNTSGVVISAKTYESLQLLNQLIRERQVTKKYHAILLGHLGKNQKNMRGSGRKKNQHKNKQSETYISVTEPLFVGYNSKTGRSQTFVNHEKGKESRTDIYPVQYITHPILGQLTLAKVHLHTGRMHQIRVHAAHIGHPVLGDLTYGTPAANRLGAKKCGITRQLLHASSYGFYNQLSDTHHTFESPLPSEIVKLIDI